jgi:SAM-dependent methyltransferase
MSVRSPLHAFTVFAGALLLLAVQPMLGKRLLPWFGGSPAVWSACLFFFQTLLLLGYALADQLVRRANPRAQLLAVLALLGCALGALPIGPGPGERPEATAQPALEVLALLLRDAALPYVALATAAPIVQHWHLHATGRSPYPLYAVSNAGSLLGLLLYPFAIEPRFDLDRQVALFSAAFWVFAAALSATGALAARRVRAGQNDASAGAGASGFEQGLRSAPYARWFALAALPSALLLAGTNQITLDLAAGPLLWVLPLALYLLSLVIAFGAPRLCARGVLLPAFTVSTAALGVAVFEQGAVSLLQHLAAVFTGSLLCHGELVRARPDGVHASRFYLTTAAGAAAGSLFVALLAPQLFASLLELPLVLIGTYGMMLVAVRGERDPRRGRRERRWVWFGLGLTAALFLATSWATASGRSDAGRVLEQRRSFFGVLRVSELPDATVLTHGRIRHGMQFRDPARRQEPTLYYSRGSAAGRALLAHASDRARAIGVVGLGAGTLAAYGRAGDRIRFYEIDPDVVAIARRHFSFLRGSGAAIEVAAGDARLALEREAAQRFDLLLIDAFASDSVPAHLLTVEAFAIYLRHLRRDGVLLVHIANRHLDLARVVAGAARRHGLPWRVVETQSDAERGAARTRWALLARDRAVLDRAAAGAAGLPLDGPPLAWTDAFSDLVRVLR